jgi:signal transduction histidine kinase
MTSPTPDELRSLFLFEALDDEQLAWLAASGDVRAYDGDAVVFREGEPAEALWVLLRGGLQLSRTLGNEDVLISRTTHRGAYAGATRAYVDEPESEYVYTVLTTEPSAFFRLPAADFATFMRDWHPLAVHLLDGLYVGIRNSEATSRQHEHLARLGTLSATLAHELNNPAAAAVRATGQLRERVAGMRAKLGMIASGPIDRAAIADLVQAQERSVELAAKSRRRLSAVEEADLEDALVDRFEELGVAAALDLAPVFVAAGLGVEWLDELADSVADGLDGPLGAGALDGPLRWMAYTVETENLMDEIEEATTRISTLVAAVKQYSFMDSASRQEVDLHTGLDSTVVMLGHKLAGVGVERDYDLGLPHVPAYGAELNQVWTNLIDNAADAMEGTGRLVLRTSRDGDDAVVEVQDEGTGIPEALRERVFDAFFTTKGAGRGSGLGLDSARRIVEQRHGGTLGFSTGPGGTTFRVTLPLSGTSRA